VDTSTGPEALPLLKSRAGLSFWHCSEEAFTAGEGGDPKALQDSLRRLPPLLPSMFPPGTKYLEIA